MSEPTTEKEKTKATGNPYIALLDEMIHRRRKRLPERIVQFKFCRFVLGSGRIGLGSLISLSTPTS